MKPSGINDMMAPPGSQMYPPDMGGAPRAASTPDGCVNVPLASLAQPDDSEEVQTPAVGDSGTMSVDYEVVSITGDQACVRPSAINGKPLDDNEDEPTPDDAGGEDAGMDQEGAGMRDEAVAMGGQ